MAKVLVAMSGGVDSSVAAALLRDQGHEVIGVFMRLGSPGESLDEMSPFDTAGVSCDPTKIKIGHQGCCSINDAADARLVAAELGVPFYVCNFKKDFGRIIDYFVDEYADGRTPNPCVRCNDWLKFGKLHDYAKQIGATHVASGHYARVLNNELHRGADESKDQSYVLFGIPRAQLETTMFPIGPIETKQEVRDLAERFGLPTFDKPDSQEICFVPDNDYAGLVERRRPDLAVGGEIRDTSGRVLGEHQGQHRFTIGQRRGIGVALGHPIYVVDKDPASNTVTIGSEEDLVARSLTAIEPNFLCDPSSLQDWRPVKARHRYNGTAVEAEVRLIPSGQSGSAVDSQSTEATVGGKQSLDGVGTPSGRPGGFEVRFAEPQRAVTPGQAVVLYEGSRVLGGGWISGVS